MFGKKEKIIKNVETEEVEGAKVWVVSWNTWKSYNAVCGPTANLTENKGRVAKAFLSKEDADKYADSLREAMKFIQSDLYLGIKIEEQK